MLSRIVFALSVVLGACGGDDGSTPSIDAPAGATCTNATYDPCTTNTECTSNNCHLFEMAGIQVCTAPCTPGDNSTCPVDASGVNGVCNNMGTCKPAVANDCTR